MVAMMNQNSGNGSKQGSSDNSKGHSPHLNHKVIVQEIGGAIVYPNFAYERRGIPYKNKKIFFDNNKLN